MLVLVKALHFSLKKLQIFLKNESPDSQTKCYQADFLAENSKHTRKYIVIFGLNIRNKVALYSIVYIYDVKLNYYYKHITIIIFLFYFESDNYFKICSYVSNNQRFILFSGLNGKIFRYFNANPPTSLVGQNLVKNRTNLGYLSNKS